MAQVILTHKSGKAYEAPSAVRALRMWFFDRTTSTPTAPPSDLFSQPVAVQKSEASNPVEGVEFVRLVLGFIQKTYGRTSEVKEECLVNRLAYEFACRQIIMLLQECGEFADVQFESMPDHERAMHGLRPRPVPSETLRETLPAAAPSVPPEPSSQQGKGEVLQPVPHRRRRRRSRPKGSPA